MKAFMSLAAFIAATLNSLPSWAVEGAVEEEVAERGLWDSFVNSLPPAWLWVIALAFLFMPTVWVWQKLPEKYQKWWYIAPFIISIVLAYLATVWNPSGIYLAATLTILVGGCTFLFWKSGGFKKTTAIPPPPADTCSNCGSAKSPGKFCGNCGHTPTSTQPVETKIATTPPSETDDLPPATQTPEDPLDDR